MSPTHPNYSALLELEAELSANYINGVSIEDRATAGSKAGPVFLATASASTEDRQATFERWRARQIATLESNNDVIAEYLAKDCDKDVAAAYRSGLLALESLSAGVALVQHEKESLAAAAALASQSKLEKVLRKLIVDADPGHTGADLSPSGFVVCADGTFKLYSGHLAAQTYAAQCGQRCMVGEVVYRPQYRN